MRLIQFLKRPFIYAGIFGFALTAISAYILLDIFLIPHAYESVQNSGTSTAITELDSQNSTDINSTSTSYKDSNIEINITTIRENNTNIYIADIRLASASLLKTALAKGTVGTNITAKTSVTAADNNAILAINGDYYGANNRGYVIKNGTLYRSTVRSDTEYDDLVIYEDGTFEIINESDVSAEQLIADGVVQLFAFGPALITDSEISVSQSTEVGQSMSSNPRTAIGIIDANHYIMVVSDGRTSESTGLSLYELASVMKEYNCTIAYNLDGGGSSTMYFNGMVINQPTTNGKKISERSVSDIVYIGY